MTDEQYRAAAERCKILVRWRAEILRKVETINNELDELTAAMLLYCGD